MKFKYLKVVDFFLQVFYFLILIHLNIDMVNISIFFFGLMRFVFIIKIILKPPKNDKILGTFLGYVLKSK